MADSTQLLNLLQGQLSDGMLNELSNRLGVNNQEKTAVASAGIISTLLEALSRNAAQPQGAESLNRALRRDHDGSILSNVMGVLSGQQQVNNPKTLNGLGILQHVLGGRQSSLAEGVSRMSGLNSSQVSMLMTMLAPIVMGALGKVTQQEDLGPNELSGLLQKTSQAQREHNPQMSLLTRLLDQDGDGSILDDVANIGMRFLGGFLNKR